MRTNLIVKYEEKDTVRRLGAKWDNARKVWYIENMTDIQPFMKWIPDQHKKPHEQKYHNPNIKPNSKKKKKK
jgi:hypothetical protein